MKRGIATMTLLLCAVLLYIPVNAEAAAINRIFMAFDRTISSQDYYERAVVQAERMFADRKLRKQLNDQVMIIVAINDSVTTVFDGRMEANFILRQHLDKARVIKSKSDVFNVNDVIRRANEFFGRPTNEPVTKYFFFFGDCLATGMPGRKDSKVALIGKEELDMLKNFDLSYFLYADDKAEREYGKVFGNTGLTSITVKTKAAMESGYKIPAPRAIKISHGGVGKLLKGFIFILIACFVFVIVIAFLISRKKGARQSHSNTWGNL